MKRLSPYTVSRVSRTITKLVHHKQASGNKERWTTSELDHQASKPKQTDLDHLQTGTQSKQPLIHRISHVDYIPFVN